VWIVLLSSVLEKGADMGIATLKESLKHLTTTNVQHLECWSDTGPSYRSYKYLGSVLPLALLQHKWTASINFNCEAHGKSACDSLFANLNRWRFDAGCSEPLLDINHVAAALNARAEAERQLDPSRPEIKVLVFRPEPKWSYDWMTLKASSCPALITAAYNWSFKMSDYRAVALRGKGHMYDVLTRVDARCRTMSRLSSPWTINFKPTVEPPPKPTTTTTSGASSSSSAPAPPPPVAPVAEDSADTVKSVEKSAPQKMLDGWRVAYRLASPETTPAEIYIKRWVRKMDSIKDFVDISSARRNTSATAKQSLPERQAIAKDRCKTAKTRAAALKAAE
jgi:hypothetical protein